MAGVGVAPPPIDWSCFSCICYSSSSSYSLCLSLCSNSSRSWKKWENGRMRLSSIPCASGEMNKNKERMRMRMRKRGSRRGDGDGDPKMVPRILWTEAAIKGIHRKASAIPSNKHKHSNLWAKAVLQALEDAIRQSRWESALSIFALLRKQRWYQPRCGTYARLMMMLSACGRGEEAASLFSLLPSDGLRPTLDVLTALVCAHASCGRFDTAFSAVRRCNPDAHTYGVLLKCCVQRGRLDLVPDVLADMSSRGVRCTAVAYNTVLRGYARAALFDRMEALLSQMIESESEPDAFTMNSFLWAHGSRGRIPEMEAWYEEFQLMGVAPDAATFNILIASYGGAGLHAKVEAVLRYMEERFYPPTAATFNTLIRVHARAGNVREMERFFLAMKHRLKPNAVTYCTLVHAYAAAGNLSKVDSVLRQARNSDVALDTPFFNSAIAAYARAGRLDKMRGVLLLMEQAGCQPDHVTLAAVAQTH